MATFEDEARTLSELELEAFEAVSFGKGSLEEPAALGEARTLSEPDFGAFGALSLWGWSI